MPQVPFKEKKTKESKTGDARKKEEVISAGLQ
jgi:hypothetical protein